MKLVSKKNIYLSLLSIFLSAGIGTSFGQSACCSSKAPEKTKTSSCSSKESKKSTSGCSPSGCRGAKTKFGEAKVISDLRLDLIDLKAKMEASKTVEFEARSYDIHGIIGETDDESLEIIIREFKIVQKAFEKSLNLKVSEEKIPSKKAKQIVWLKDRIKNLSTKL